MNSFGSFAFAFACGLLVSAGVASAQWLNHPDPRIPRTSDGKPNLTAPAPKLADGKTDFSGIWRVPARVENLSAGGVAVPFQPWAAALFKARQDNDGRDRPSGRCLPHTIPDAMLPPVPFKIVHTPGLTIFLYEEFVDFRQVFTDGRTFPKNPNPAWWGYSIGRWDGDAFVVDSTGFNDQSWLDDAGHPHTDALHVTERFRRIDFGHLEMQITFDDPKAYTKPWGTTVRFDLLADTELIEFVCENEKDWEHIRQSR